MSSLSCNSWGRTDSSSPTVPTGCLLSTKLLNSKYQARRGERENKSPVEF